MSARLIAFTIVILGLMLAGAAAWTPSGGDEWPSANSRNASVIGICLSQRLACSSAMF